MKMDLRQANQYFSRAMKAVKGGREVVLTDRGTPIAVIRPMSRHAGPDAVLRRLEAAGVLRRAAKPTPMPPWTPRRLRGAPITKTLGEERETS
jgi:antitoxin (DNA-binding transcriptional repressor) of toxin-antitoxin stability system